jgi:beta-N-acetylhexosaminidase
MPKIFSTPGGDFKLSQDPAIPKKVEKILSKMTLEEKLGQMMTFEFCGTRITPDVIRSITKYHCGGLRVTPHIFEALDYSKRHGISKEQEYQRLSPYAGPEQYAEMINELQRLAKKRPHGIPLHISLDQEGDWSQDLSRGGVNLFPSAMGLAATGDPKLVYHSFKAVATQLRAQGINMLHSPVLDVNTNPLNPEIGTRSFSDDPETCVKFALQQIKAFRDAGVIATGKHFPGRGDSAVDVHFTMDVNKSNKDRLMKVELYPYLKLIAAGLPAIMTAHNLYPALDDSGKPASVSPKIIKGFLRKELGFNGIVTSDAMGMRGVIEMYKDYADACAASLAAGNDLTLAKGAP